MKTVKKIVKIVLCVLLALIFVASLISIISSIGQRKKGYTGAFGFTFEIVQTESMSAKWDYDEEVLGFVPEGIEKGDIVIGKIIDADTVINVGDIITYKTTVNGQKITKTHRVSSIKEEGTFGTVYYTWGDNRVECPTVDAGFRTRDEVVAVYQTKLSGVGKPIMALKTPAGYLALAIPIGLYILYEIFVLIGIFMNNKKTQMLEETTAAKNAIIEEYLRSRKEASGEATDDGESPKDDLPKGEEEEQDTP